MESVSPQHSAILRKTLTHSLNIQPYKTRERWGENDEKTIYWRNFVSKCLLGSYKRDFSLIVHNFESIKGFPVRELKKLAWGFWFWSPAHDALQSWCELNVITVFMISIYSYFYLCYWIKVNLLLVKFILYVFFYFSKIHMKLTIPTTFS